MKNKILVVLLCASCFMALTGQDTNFKQKFLDAEYYYMTENYSSALRSYESLLKLDPENANLNFLCGNCILKSGGDAHYSISLLEKATQGASSSYKEGSYKERNAPLYAYFLLARAFHIDNQFERAMEIYTTYQQQIDEKNFAEIEFVNASIKACELGKSMMGNPIDVEFIPLIGNLSCDCDVEYPVASGNDSIMVFSTKRNTGVNVMMSVKEDGGWSKAQVINPQIGLSGNFYPVSISFDGTELYLIHGDLFNSDIYVSHREANRWTRAEKLNNHINTKYTESHAAVSRDGSKLYFVSDRKGGMGGLDIYVSERTGGDEWGEPVNLGEPVNSFYNEGSPFLTDDDSWLFFSSQGHNTMGGYDIFFCNLNNTGSWETPVNIGYPINTTGDELFFNPGWNRSPCLFAMKKEDPSGQVGLFSIGLPPLESLYAMEDLQDDESDSESSDSGTGTTTPGTREAASPAKLPGIYYILNNILFEYNESTISEEASRDVNRIYILMRKFPEISVELTGHADAIGSQDYNLRLSDMRARSVADYLISNGIEPERIVIRAKGESAAVAINQYEDGSDAPEGRRLNRHVSITITNLSNDKIRVAEIFVPDDLIPKEDKGYTVLLFQSADPRDNTPGEILNEPVSVISTEQAFMYTAGQFPGKMDAITYLNEAIDNGYPDARIIERRSLESLVTEQSTSDPFDPKCYTIQFMALKRERDVSYFKELPSVRRYDCTDGFFRYVTGTYGSIEEAMKDIPGIKESGYKHTMILPCARYQSMILPQ